MAQRKRVVRFKAVKVVKEPTIVEFTTKEGARVSFEAVKGVSKKVDVQFKAKQKKK
jgi:hypothetical protein